MSHTPSSAPRALSAGEALLLKARVFVDYVASCGNAEAHELVHAIDAHLSAAPPRAVEIDESQIEESDGSDDGWNTRHYDSVENSVRD